VPVIRCEGFEPPLREFAALSVRDPRRVVPVKARLFDDAGREQTDDDLVYPPVIEIVFLGSDPAAIGPSIGMAEKAEGRPPREISSSGNQFFYRGSKWRFNLRPGDAHSAPGLYGVTIVSGNESWYVIEPACFGSFVIE
jgi:hypothetical protein